jgi:hypothetical protein
VGNGRPSKCPFAFIKYSLKTKKTRFWPRLYNKLKVVGVLFTQGKSAFHASAAGQINGDNNNQTEYADSWGKNIALWGTAVNHKIELTGFQKPVNS